MMYLSAMVYTNRNLSQHYKSVDGFHGIDFKAVRINNYIIPRATLHYDYDLIWGYEPSKLFYLTSFENEDSTYENEDSTECEGCEFAENCNGQLCMFAMM